MEKRANSLVKLLDEAQDSLQVTTGFEWEVKETDDVWQILAQDETEQRVILSVDKKVAGSVWPIEDDSDFIINYKNYFSDALIAELDSSMDTNSKIISTIDAYLKFKNPDADVVSLLNQIKKFLL